MLTVVSVCTSDYTRQSFNCDIHAVSITAYLKIHAAAVRPQECAVPRSHAFPSTACRVNKHSWVDNILPLVRATKCFLPSLHLCLNLFFPITFLHLSINLFPRMYEYNGDQSATLICLDTVGGCESKPLLSVTV